MISAVRLTIEDIFQTAADLAPDARIAYLDEVCGDDPLLRREVEELLRFDAPAESFLEKPALQDAARELAKEITVKESTLAEAGRMLGSYRVLGELGRGGMGVVYLALDTRDDRQVAIKVLPKHFVGDADRMARFTREGRMLSELKRLKHPNIAEIYEQAEYDSKPIIALEYVPGDTLADRLDAGPLPIGEALQIAQQIADALSSAHAQQIVHRDLKPANIKITPEGQVKVLDFGLAKHFQAELADADVQTRSPSPTESGMLMGTPAYMSPEQWNGRAVDQRTDIWALGCLLYEMLTGRDPFSGRNRAETMKAVFEANPDWQALPAGTPLVVQNLIRLCLQRNAEDRLPSATEARRTLSEAITENRFALSLYLKTWFWRISRRTKIVAVISAACLVIFLLWTQTTIPNLLFKRVVISDKDDLATLLPQWLEGATPEQVRAALLPGNQGMDDLLQAEQGQSLRERQQQSQDAIDQVIETVNSRIKSRSDSAQLQAVLAQAYLFKFYLREKVEDKERALQAVLRAQSLEPNTNEFPASVLVAEGNVLFALGKYSEAIAAFKHVRDRDGDDPEALIGLARAYDLSGDQTGQAENYYRSAIEVRPRREGRPSWADYDSFGWFYFERGQYEQAANVWREIVRIKPFGTVGYTNLGNALLYLGCFDEAAKNYNDSINVGGETPRALINSGVAYFYAGNFGEAIIRLERVTGKDGAAEDPALIEAWGNLGDAYLQNQQVIQAAQAYQAALKLVEQRLVQFHDDPWMISLKAEFMAKLTWLGRRDPSDEAHNLVEATLSPERNCLECRASAVAIYHFLKKDDKATKAAAEAVAAGYSPVLLWNNPHFVDLRDRSEFKQIGQLAQSKIGPCQSYR